MRNVQKWSWVVAVAGFLFGFDTVVISGANEPIRELWNTDAWFHGTFIMSMALWGTVLGSLFGGKPLDAWGRKPTLFWIGVLYTVSAIGSGLAWDPYSFSFFRFIGGVGVGASSVAAPAYISEISSAASRGRLVALYQFNIVFGILIAFLSNYFLAGVGGGWDWRLMLGVEAIPAIVYTLMVWTVPESPRWLAVKKGDPLAAKQVLTQLFETSQEAEETLHAIQADATATSSKPDVPLFSRKFRFPLLLAFLLAMFNQLSGINFILYYAPSILENAGFASSESLLSSFTLTFILMFIASHAMGQGAVIWVFISEIFPNSVRGAGQSWGTGTHWVFAAMITLLGPVVQEAFPEGWPIFVFFAVCMILQLGFTHWIMPETKGKSLEELQDDLQK
ncbi:MAG: MFS transporter [Flavobacteriia bacterium]|nr:MFS transporter [Flavobacteriia bacterium]